VQTWPGGFKAEITVSAVGAPVNGWQVSWVLPPAQTVRQSWNVILATQGGRVEARNLDYNGAVRPGSATTFGLVAAGPGTSPAGTLTCRALA